jgi:hypothetical protein
VTKKFGTWRYVFAQQVKLKKALAADPQRFVELTKLLSKTE